MDGGSHRRNADLILPSVSDILPNRVDKAQDKGITQGERFKGVIVMKEVLQGKDYLHVISCSSSEGVCEANLEEVACEKIGSRISSCLPCGRRS